MNHHKYMYISHKFYIILNIYIFNEFLIDFVTNNTFIRKKKKNLYILLKF